MSIGCERKAAKAAYFVPQIMSKSRNHKIGSKTLSERPFVSDLLFSRQKIKNRVWRKRARKLTTFERRWIMEGVTGAAAALSTYGLYFIVAVLGFVIYKLFCKTSALEREFRGYMQRETAESKAAHEQLLADSTAAMQASTAAIKDSTDAINRIAAFMEKN